MSRRQIGFHAEHIPLTPTERLERIKAEHEDPITVSGGVVHPPDEEWYYEEWKRAQLARCPRCGSHWINKMGVCQDCGRAR